MSDLSDLSDLSDICAAKISRAGKKARSQYPTGKSSRRTAIPARYDSFSAAPRRARRRYGAGAQPAAAPVSLSCLTGYTKLALRCRQSTVRSNVKKQQRFGGCFLTSLPVIVHFVHSCPYMSIQNFFFNHPITGAVPVVNRPITVFFMVW